MRVSLTKQEALADPMLRHLRGYIQDHEDDKIEFDIGEDGSVGIIHHQVWEPNLGPVEVFDAE